MSRNNGSLQRFALLDAYRGIAALLVVLYHFTAIFRDSFGFNLFGGAFLFGQSGVDFFFILSSFILAYRYSQTPFTKNSALIFLKKRFIRIYPAYWIVACIVFLSYIFLFPNLINPLFVFSSITLYPYWPRLITPAWTIAYEVFFYILFACLSVIKNKIVSTIAILSYASFLLFYSLQIKQIPLVDLPLVSGLFNFTTHYIILEFFIGLLLFRLYKFLSHMTASSIKMWLGVFVFFLILAFIAYPANFASFNDVRRLLFIAVPMSGLILFSSLLESKIQINIPKLATLLGSASYSIFITHAFFLSVQTKLMRMYPNWNNTTLFLLEILGILGAISVGVAYYQLVEKRLVAKQ